MEPVFSPVWHLALASLELSPEKGRLLIEAESCKLCCVHAAIVRFCKFPTEGLHLDCDPPLGADMLRSQSQTHPNNKTQQNKLHPALRTCVGLFRWGQPTT